MLSIDDGGLITPFCAEKNDTLKLFRHAQKQKAVLNFFSEMS